MWVLTSSVNFEMLVIMKKYPIFEIVLISWVHQIILNLFIFLIVTVVTGATDGVGKAYAEAVS